MLDRSYIALRLKASADLGLGQVDSALRQFYALRARMEEHPVIVGWYWRMPLQLEIAEALLRQGELAEARLEAQKAIELTQAAAERTWQARALELDARVAIAEGDLPRAEEDLAQALEAMEGYETPLAAWRVHRTMARLHPERTASALHAAATVRALAESLQRHPELQCIFLATAGADVPAMPEMAVLRTGAGSGPQ